MLRFDFDHPIYAFLVPFIVFGGVSTLYQICQRCMDQINMLRLKQYDEPIEGKCLEVGYARRLFEQQNY